MLSLLDLFLPPLTMLFVVMDPIGNMPIFMSLTESPRPGYRQLMAKRSVLIGFCVMLFFAYAGEAFLNLLGISMPAFRIAGGIMLFIVALQMIFVEEQKEKAAGEITEDPYANDVAVFPLAVPLIAGPGSIASIILLMSERHGQWKQQLYVISALAIVSLITYILFRLSNYFARVLGKTINTVISKLLGIVLGAMASQFVIDGVRSLLE
ncbi:MAG: MarC family protein [Alphaproteobacteria bacterium]|nr:MarC family protein [Alphaproteobacteria bacterium]